MHDFSAHRHKLLLTMLHNGRVCCCLFFPQTPSINHASLPGTMHKRRLYAADALQPITPTLENSIHTPHTHIYRRQRSSHASYSQQKPSNASEEHPQLFAFRNRIISCVLQPCSIGRSIYILSWMHGVNSRFVQDYQSNPQANKK